MTYKVSYTTYCDHYIEAHESTSNKDCSPLQKEVQHPSYKNAQSTEMNVLIRLYEYLQCILIQCSMTNLTTPLKLFIIHHALHIIMYSKTYRNSIESVQLWYNYNFCFSFHVLSSLCLMSYKPHLLNIDAVRMSDAEQSTVVIRYSQTRPEKRQNEKATLISRKRLPIQLILREMKNASVIYKQRICYFESAGLIQTLNHHMTETIIQQQITYIIQNVCVCTHTYTYRHFGLPVVLRYQHQLFPQLLQLIAQHHNQLQRKPMFFSQHVTIFGIHY